MSLSHVIFLIKLFICDCYQPFSETTGFRVPKKYMIALVPPGESDHPIFMGRAHGLKFQVKRNVAFERIQTLPTKCITQFPEKKSSLGASYEDLRSPWLDSPFTLLAKICQERNMITKVWLG